MADQTNPWDSAPATDSAAQAADAYAYVLLVPMHHLQDE